MRVLSFCFIAAWIGNHAQAQVSSDSNEVVHLSGSVVNAATGEPVRRATVGVQFLGGVRPGAAAQTTTADGNGHFELFGLTPGQYQLWAERRGYPRQNYASGLSISKDQLDLVFRMTPYSAIIGSVVDEYGDPLMGATVQLVRSEISQGRRQMRLAPGAVTNDKGMYRAAALPPGRYYISATAISSTARVPGASAGDTEYGRLFYAGAAELATATAIELEPGAEARADFRLEPEQVFQVRGSIAEAEIAEGISVNLVRHGVGENFGGQSHAVRMQAGGSFEISGVAPGRYFLVAGTYKASGRETAECEVVVGHADVEGITLVLRHGTELTGRVRVEEGGAALDASRIGINLDPRDTGIQPTLSARLDPGMTFSIPDAAPGYYLLRVQLPEPYYVKAASTGGLDALANPVAIRPGEAAAPLDLVIGWNGGEVSGTVSVQDKPVANCAVLLTPRNGPSRSLERIAATDRNGRFLLRAVAPGDYLAYSWPDINAVEYGNAETLQRYSAEGVTVTAGGKETIELKLNGN
ncbi:MAG: carboxypeptidase regulatory-like domain-containing protein [Acidobacteriota bacterium]|nr:carboxypeptidase regulatory-like domain-containing protein [Acidobacteriota bacterium]